MPSPEGSSVQFRRTAPDIRLLAVKRFARKLQREIAGGRAFHTLIAGDAELRQMNRAFRGKDYATDVLSFPLAGIESGGPKAARRYCNGGGTSVKGLDQNLGDLAISIGRARAQARQFGHSVEEEVRILMLHGLLHLLGMDHESDSGRMARAERRWRLKLGLPNGVIDRVAS